MREHNLAEGDQVSLFGSTQVVLFVLGKHGDQKDRHGYAPEHMDGPVTTALAAALASNADLAQSATQ